MACPYSPSAFWSPITAAEYHPGDHVLIQIFWDPAYKITSFYSTMIDLMVRSVTNSSASAVVLHNARFVFNTTSWTLADPQCPQTWLNIDWHIPEDFVVDSDPDYWLIVENVTTAASTGTWQSNVFRIKNQAPGSTSTSSQSSSTIATGSPTTSQPAITSTTQTDEPAPSPGSTLSTGAKAGIGIGAALFIVFLGGCLLLWRRRRRAAHVAQHVPNEMNTNIKPGADTARLPWARRPELQGVSRVDAELP